MFSTFVGGVKSGTRLSLIHYRIPGKRFGMAENNNNGCRAVAHNGGNSTVENWCFLSTRVGHKAAHLYARHGTGAARCLRSKNIVRNNAIPREFIFFIFLFLSLCTCFFFFLTDLSRLPRATIATYDFRRPLSVHVLPAVTSAGPRPYLTVTYALRGVVFFLFSAKIGRGCYAVFRPVRSTFHNRA